MKSISVVDYRPDPDLDAELAQLVYMAVQGWSDQRPITGALVRSLLRPAGMTATTLALHRDDDGQLLGFAALRWPATLDTSGRLWGPYVRPDERGKGVGRALLDAISEVLLTRPGTSIVTAEIPEARTCGWSLFEKAGWHSAHNSRLLSRELGGDSNAAVPLSVRSVRPGEYLDTALAGLFAEVRPQLGYATARDTYARWTSDARYNPAGLLLTEGPEGLSGAALVYLLSNPALGEPAEALLADLLTCPKLEPDAAETVRSALVAAALQVGAAAGAKVARAVVECPYLEATLQAAGFTVADQIRFYTPPAGVPAGVSAGMPVALPEAHGEVAAPA